MATDRTKALLATTVPAHSRSPPVPAARSRPHAQVSEILSTPQLKGITKVGWSTEAHSLLNKYAVGALSGADGDHLDEQQRKEYQRVKDLLVKSNRLGASPRGHERRRWFACPLTSSRAAACMTATCVAAFRC